MRVLLVVSLLLLLVTTVLAYEEEIDLTNQVSSSLLWSSHSPDDSSSSLPWPFHRTNSTERSCAHHETCDECNQASWCHWCGTKQSCHVIGSVYGCARGSSCHEKKKSNETSACTAHTNCTSCALSSHVCHWCAHDNACHAVGSVYGCVTGVDCYSNDQCQRKEPEPVHDVTFTEMGPLPMLIVLGIGCLLICCTSCCYCVASGVKGAYDDLAGLAMAREEELNEPLLAPRPPPVTPESAVAVDTTSTGQQDDDAAEEEQQEPAVANETSQEHLEEGTAEDDDDGTGYVSFPQEPRVALEQDDDARAPLLAQPRPSSRRSRRPRAMQRLYNACTACYIVSVAVIGVSVISAIRYYPKRPEYNICNDSVAWSSLIDSMASAKVSADFEILASLFNPNHVDAVLDMGKGSFYHDGAFVGTFDIPPVTAKAMSISDVMVIAHFTPEKWDALAITTEYYRGKLVLHVDTKLTIRVPALADYSFTVDKKDMVVHVNEMSDRHLCHCPKWKDVEAPQAEMEAGMEELEVYWI